MNAKKVINANRATLKAHGDTLFTLDSFYADFMKLHGDELSDYDMQQPGLIRRWLRELCPHLK